MATSFVYPDRDDMEFFVRLLKDGNYSVSKYLPSIDDYWYEHIGHCIDYVQMVAQYEPCEFHECAARLLYKIAKRHELGDGNKRSSVIAVYLFTILNDKFVTNPRRLKEEAKRAARSKGRENETLIRSRIMKELQEIILAA